MQIEMKIKKNQLTIEVQACPVRIQQTPHGEYICVTDIEKVSKNGSKNLRNYLRNHNNIEFLALWESRRKRRKNNYATPKFL